MLSPEQALKGLAAIAILILLVCVALVIAWKRSPSLIDVPGIPDEKLSPQLRMGVMVALSAVLIGVIFWIAKQQIGVLVYKAALITTAAVLGYWTDRTLFPDTRPHVFAGSAAQRWKAEMRRVAIVAACIITVGIGA